MYSEYLFRNLNIYSKRDFFSIKNIEPKEFPERLNFASLIRVMIVQRNK